MVVTRVTVIEDRCSRGPHVLDGTAAPSQHIFGDYEIRVVVSLHPDLDRLMVQIIIRPGLEQTELPPNVRQGALEGRQSVLRQRTIRLSRALLVYLHKYLAGQRTVVVDIARSGRNQHGRSHPLQ